MRHVRVDASREAGRRLRGRKLLDAEQVMRIRGFAYPFPLAYFVLDVFRGAHHEAHLLLWDRQRVEKGIPSIYG